MRTVQHQDYPQAKQRLRSEINTHIEDFLLKGGRIEVVSQLSERIVPARFSHRTAEADMAFIPALYAE